MPARERVVRITNVLGLHARAAASFVKLSNRYSASVLVRRGTVVVNGKSIMGVLMLAAAKGSDICIVTDGPDADEALDALCKLVEEKFGEE